MGSECSPEKRPEPTAAPAAAASAANGTTGDVAKDAKTSPAAASAPVAPGGTGGADGGAGGGDEATGNAVRFAEAKMAADRKGLEDSTANKHITAEMWAKMSAQYAALYADFKAQFGSSTHPEAARVRAAADALTAKAAAHLSALQQRAEFEDVQHRLSGGGGGVDVLAALVLANGGAKKMLKLPAAERDAGEVQAKIDALTNALAAWVAARPDWSRFEGLKTLYGGTEELKGSLEYVVQLEGDAKKHIEMLKTNAAL